MPCARSRSARLAMSVHPDAEPWRFGRLLVIVPALLAEPSLRLRYVPRLAHVGRDISGIVLGAPDDVPQDQHRPSPPPRISAARAFWGRDDRRGEGRRTKRSQSPLWRYQPSERSELYSGSYW